MKRLKFTDRSSGETFVMGGGDATIDVSLPTLYVTSSMLTVNKADNTIMPLTTAKNEVECEYRFVGEGKAFDDNGTIAYQGNSSIDFPKKNFSINFSKKHRFKDWLEMDEYHAKGYCTDGMVCRDILSNQMIEHIYKERENFLFRPYSRYNNFQEDSIKNTIDVGALCHVDGFPINLYINDVYWGLYSFNIKKDRKNYMMDKADSDHIMVQASVQVKPSVFVPNFSVSSFANGGDGWHGIEFRNPKSIIDINGNEYNGDFPTEPIGDNNAQYDSTNKTHVQSNKIKRAWQDFIRNVNAVTASSSVEELTFLNVEEWVDMIILGEFIGHIDNWGNNTLYASWDGGNHWSPLFYDMDSSWGAWTKMSSLTLDTLPANGDVYQAYRSQAPWILTLRTVLIGNIKLRYKELRDKKILDAQFVKNMFNAYTRKIGNDALTNNAKRWDIGVTNDRNTKLICEWIYARIRFMDNLYL